MPATLTLPTPAPAKALTLASIWLLATTPAAARWLPALASGLSRLDLDAQPLPSTDRLAELSSLPLTGPIICLAELETATPGPPDQADRTALAGQPNPPGPPARPTLTDLADLIALNRRCRQTGQPLLLLAPAGQTLQLGPGVVHESTPCLACFQFHRQFFLLPSGRGGGCSAVATGPSGWLRPAPVALLTALCREIAAFAAGDDCPARRGELIWLAPTGETRQTSRLFRNPTCPVCSIAAHYPTEMISMPVTEPASIIE